MAKNGEFLHEIEDALDRRADNGTFWCPETSRRDVEYWVTVRDQSFFNALLQMVRLVRAMQLADEMDYSSFLYLQFDTLRARGFARAFGTQAVRRRFAGRIEVDEARLRFIEPAMALPSEKGTAGRVFDLGYEQMPPLAALLDVLHSGLGFGPVAEMLSPVTRGVPGDPSEVVRILRRAWDEWLKGRIQSEHFAKKAKAIRDRLDPTRADHQQIDDAFILNTWRVLSDGDLEGFKLLRSTARTAIRYRQALRIAEAERQLRGARPFGAAGDPGTVDMDRLRVDALPVSNWVSPLPALAKGNPIKWLKNREEDLKFLDDHLGASALTNDLDEKSGALSGPEPFDFQLGLTLLRCMMFGPLQQRLVDRLGAGGIGSEEEWAHTTILPDAGYPALLSRYEVLLANADRVCRAAAAILLRSGTLASLELLADDPDPAVRAWLTGLRESAGGDRTRSLLDGDDPSGNVVELFDGSGLLAVLAELSEAMSTPRSVPPHLDPVISVLRAATHRFDRSGFSSADRTNPIVLKALADGVDDVIVFRQALRTAIAWFATAEPAAAFNADQAVILAHLRSLYFFEQ